MPTPYTSSKNKLNERWACSHLPLWQVTNEKFASRGVGTCLPPILLQKIN